MSVVLRLRNAALEKSAIDFRFHHWNTHQKLQSEAPSALSTIIKQRECLVPGMQARGVF